MGRQELAKMAEREKMLDTLIQKYGFESEPVLYFAKWAWKDLYNTKIYFNTALNWRFDEDE